MVAMGHNRKMKKIMPWFCSIHATFTTKKYNKLNAYKLNCNSGTTKARDVFVIYLLTIYPPVDVISDV